MVHNIYRLVIDFSNIYAVLSNKIYFEINRVNDQDANVGFI